MNEDKYLMSEAKKASDYSKEFDKLAQQVDKVYFKMKKDLKGKGYGQEMVDIDQASELLYSVSGSLAGGYQGTGVRK